MATAYLLFIHCDFFSGHADFLFLFFNKNSKVLVTLMSFAPRHTVAVTRRPNTGCHRGLKVVRRRRGGARRRLMMIFASKGDLTGTQQVTQNIHWRCFLLSVCLICLFILKLPLRRWRPTRGFILPGADRHQVEGLGRVLTAMEQTSNCTAASVSSAVTADAE